MSTYEIWISISGVNGGAYQQCANQLDRVQISGGSSNGLDQPQPAIAAVQFVGASGVAGGSALLNDYIGQQLKIKVVYSGMSVEWSGFTITNAALSNETSDGLVNLTELMASGPLYKLNKYTLNNTDLAAGAESAWMTWVNGELGITWGQYSGGVLWQDEPVTMTWAAFETVPQITSDFSISRNFIATTASPSDAFSYLQDVAMNNDCWLYESNGSLIYAQRDALASDAAITVEPYHALDNLQTSIDVASFYNDITVTNGTASAWAGNANSIWVDGQNSLTVSSLLSNPLDLDTLADTKLAAYGNGGYTSLSNISIDFDKVSVASSAEMVQWLDVCRPQNLVLNFGTIIQGNYLGASNKYQSRGGVLDISCETISLTRNVVPYNVYAANTQTWAKVSATSTWATYKTALTTWNNIN